MLWLRAAVCLKNFWHLNLPHLMKFIACCIPPGDRSQVACIGMITVACIGTITVARATRRQSIPVARRFRRRRS